LPAVGQEPAEAEAETETPDWLADLQTTAETSEAEAEVEEFLPEPVEVDDTSEVPDWLLDEDVDLEIPDWLGKSSELKPVAISDQHGRTDEIEAVTTSTTETEPITSEIGVEEELGEADQLSEDTAFVDDTLDVEETLEIPSWLAEASLEELETPTWLRDEAKIKEEQDKVEPSLEAIEPAPSKLLDFDKEPEAPDWLKDISGTPEEPSYTLMDSVVADQTVADRPVAKDSADVADQVKEDRPGLLAGISASLDTLKPAEKRAVEADEGDRITESTGVLAGLAPLLPVEKLSPTIPEQGVRVDNIQEAAKQFYAIATQAPQPATLPEPITRREKLLGGAVRTVLYLLFIALVALPLLPGAQKEMGGNKVPWTEPTGPWSDVLDNQRRQMISEQLGVIDVQQPDSIALVSFDYSLATAGEMQPLAEAVVGRLKGQGMRIMAISLEPEGAAIAQKTLDNILAQREEQTYGDDEVNLGYLPGQIMAVRELAISKKELSAIPDFRDKVNFDHPSRAAWVDVESLDQVDLVVTIADNPATVRWWIEQLEAAPQNDGRLLLAATSATAAPFLGPYRSNEQLDGLISGINGAAAIESVRNNFGLARQMLDSQSVAHLIIVILIAFGTMVGWMPPESPQEDAAATSKRNGRKDSARDDSSPDLGPDEASEALGQG
jgi:hypothetical protein